MEHKGSKILVRIIGCIGIVYNLIAIAVGIYAFYSFYSLTHIGNSVVTNATVAGAMEFAVFVAIVGTLGLVASVTLLFVKRWGFYLFYVSAIAEWILCIIKTSASPSDWAMAGFVTVLALIIVSQQRKLLQAPVVATPAA
jgi:hypothetical protein